jgi:hypothetical protein
MAVRLFALKEVPDDEAEEIRALLIENNVDFYETPPGKWGLSGAMLWLRDETQLDEAKRLLTEYQRKRADRAKEEYAQLKREGKHITLLDKVKQEPLKMLFYVALIALILYLSIIPFIHFL